MQDPNLKTTTYNYADPLARVRSASYPDTGGVSVSYSDVTSPNSFPLTMTVTTLTGESAGSKVATTTYDGLARPTLSQVQTSSSGPSIFAATSYDNMGRVYTASNPYYTTSDTTYGVTTYSYDAIGRKTSQVDSDGTNTQSLSYNGPTVTYTDENQNRWQRTTDALGRLTTVLEPNGASKLPSMTTKYSYDALNNLVSVIQWGGASGSPGARVRSFSYDNLSRLLSATNPETGTVGYVYDADGNVQSKTDARGVKTTYGYDALNRVLSKSSSPDASSTPSSCYQYGTSVGFIGRLVNAWTQSASLGSCSTTVAFWTKRSILSYDAMGRLLSEQQYTPSNRNGSPYSPTYAYDLAGTLLTSTNGTSATPTVGTVSFTNAFDATGRLLTLTSNWSDATHPATLFSLPASPALPCPGSSTYPYAAFGGLMNATFGNGLTLNRAYDNRLRTTCEIDTGSIVSGATSGSTTVTITGAEQSN